LKLRRRFSPPLHSWPATVREAVAEARQIGARVLIVDTLPQFAGLSGDEENSSGAALAAVQPLQLAAAEGFAIIVGRHERKGGGRVGESGRGSSAFTGAFEIILALQRAEGQGRKSIRILSGLSRFDETPASLVIDRVGNSYVVLGDETAIATAE